MNNQKSGKGLRRGKLLLLRNKRSLRIIPFILVLSFVFIGCGVQNEQTQAEQEEHTTGIFAMDTYITLTAYGAQAETALKHSEIKIKELESLWSVTDESSEIYRVNHNGGTAVEVSTVTAEILDFTIKMAEQTNGTLDPTIYPVLAAWGFTTGTYRIPAENELSELLQHIDYEKISIEGNSITLPDRMQIDLGAVGKGYAGDIISELMKEQGVSSALLDIGGNIQMIGAKTDGSKWRLGIKSAFGDGNYGVLEAEDCAAITSGGYERYFTGTDGQRYWHIIDPDTGYPADSGLISVLIVAKEGKLCDALSTAIFVMGLEDAENYWKEKGGFEMLLVTEENEIYLTEGIENDFTLNEEYLNMKVYVIER